MTRRLYSDPEAVAEAERLRQRESEWPEHKNRQLQMLWNADYPPYQIAEQIGASSGGAVIAQATRLRNQGWEIKWRSKTGRAR